MKTYKNLYPKLCSYKNIELAFKKASKGKTKKFYVIEFKKNLNENILQLKQELERETYRPAPLKKFTIRDPKTRLIRKSTFKDRIVHHAIVNILEPIYEPRFISDSYANRLNKGTLPAIKRLSKFIHQVSKNGRCIKNAKFDDMTKGYVLKADIKRFFDSIDQNKLMNILKREVKDSRLIWLIIKVLKNFDNKKIGMPLGNMTSQFFANIYLNELDYFIKRRLKAKFYIRYVDDFVILHENKNELIEYKEKIEKYLMNLRLELHPTKSKIFSLYRGIDFLGFKTFFHYKRIRKRNVKYFKKRLKQFEEEYKAGVISSDKLLERVEGWFAYVKWGNTYNLRKSLVKKIKKILKIDIRLSSSPPCGRQDL